VAAYENRRGLNCNENEVLITVGACEALYTALFGILNPGEEVIVPTPAFPLYETIATTAGAKVVELDLKKTNFQITKESLESVITPKTKAIVLNSPNNPSGAVYSEESLAAVKAAVLGKPIYVICDNVYQQLSTEKLPDLSLDEELKDQILLCQSFSKPYAMTGWRVGYLIGSEEVISRLLLLHAGMVTAIPTFLQTACITALETDTTPMAEVYAKRREFVCRRLREMGFNFPEPKGAFYVFPDITKFGMDSGEFCTRLIKEAKVATVPGSCFGAEGHIRISYCCSDENLQKGMDRLEEFLKTV
jgi:aminotransferase